MQFRRNFSVRVIIDYISYCLKMKHNIERRRDFAISVAYPVIWLCLIDRVNFGKVINK